MAASAKRKVLLSGGIGAGKSTVGRLLAALGAEVISADHLGHAALEPGSTAHRAVSGRWPDVVATDGTIDRSRLADIVFTDPVSLRELEDITHPAIRAAAHRRTEDSAAEVVVVEVPLQRDLLGPGWLRVVVHADADLRRQRLRSRGMDPADVERRMAAQPADAEWRRWADLAIDNSGDEADLRREVDDLWRRIHQDRPKVGRSRLAPRVE